MSTDELIALWHQARTDAPHSEFALHREVAGCFVATSPAETAALIVPLSHSALQRGRVLGNIRFRCEEALRFDVDGKSWEQPAAVIDCLDAALLRTFCVVVRDVLAQLESGDASAKQVVEALCSWDDRMRRTNRLTDAAELGLWGELFLISRSSSPDAMASAWRGDHEDAIRFCGGGIALECKTSESRMRHTLVRDRATSHQDAICSHFASVWAVEDRVAGKTLPELVDDVMLTVVDDGALLSKLIAAGYREDHRSEYVRRFSCPVAPAFFRFEHLPRIGVVDHGITSVCYEVDLASAPRLGKEEAREMLRQLATVASH